jgi:hypothetical protein
MIPHGCSVNQRHDVFDLPEPNLRASRLVIDALKLHKPPIYAVFLEDFLGAKGGLDVDWTKVLMEEGGWCVITADNGMARGRKAGLRGPPLHLILPARRIPGFFLAGKMASRPGFDKARAVIYTWPEILRRAVAAKEGERFKIYPSGADGYRVEPWPLRESLKIIPSPTASPPLS